MDYNKMARLHDYVYSTPANSPERERRLNELSDTDQAALWDYKQGLLSGRIKQEQHIEYQQQKGNDNMTYKEWKAANNKNSLEAMNAVIDFKLAHPDIDSRYRQRQQENEAKRREIMSIKDANERQKTIAMNLDLFD